MARILGPYLVIVPLVAVARASLMPDIVADFTASPVWAWVTGAFVLLAGLAVIAVHPYWRGAAAILVSATGWLMAIKGFLLLAFAPSYLESTADLIGTGVAWKAVELLAAVIGLYLTYSGWASPRQVTAQATDSSTHLRHTA